MPATMSPAVVRSLLEELARRLAATGATAQIRVVGGAAISLLDSSRRATDDIDAVVLGHAADVGPLVAEMATERDLPVDWFNSAVRMWIPFTADDPWVTLFEVEGVTVAIGASDMMLAMKLRASRARDHEDIGFLLADCGVTTLDKAQEIYERYLHQEVLSEAATARVRAWLDRE
jgi:Nucleotidyltransferase of unknown function (DUF6036)